MVFLIQIINVRKFFFQNFEEPLTGRELYVASCFLRSLQCDFRAIKEGFVNLSEIMEKREVRSIGHGLFPFMNLFGHSCEPHVSMFSYENNLVCRSIRPIKAGEEVTFKFPFLKYLFSAYQKIETFKDMSFFYLASFIFRFSIVMTHHIITVPNMSAFHPFQKSITSSASVNHVYAIGLFSKNFPKIFQKLFRIRKYTFVIFIEITYNQIFPSRRFFVSKQSFHHKNSIYLVVSNINVMK